jgi:hypothetical protein
MSVPKHCGNQYFQDYLRNGQLSGRMLVNNPRRTTTKSVRFARYQPGHRCSTWKLTTAVDIIDSHMRERADFLLARPE